MREIEFVPDWYSATHRRRRLLKLQLYCTIVVALALATWTVVKLQGIEAAQRLVENRTVELELSEQRVRERQVQEQLRQQLQTQERVDSSLGLNVEASRVMALIEQSMPRQASLISFDMETEERTPTLSQRAAAAKSGRSLSMERRLEVSFKGVAPSNGDVATLLENLSATGFCEQIRLEYARDRVDGLQVMREFHIRFAINLSAGGGAA